VNMLLRALRALTRADEGPDPANCILCGLTGPGCPYHGRRAA
jgi:hypothetical protein